MVPFVSLGSLEYDSKTGVGKPTSIPPPTETQLEEHLGNTTTSTHLSFVSKIYVREAHTICDKAQINESWLAHHLGDARRNLGEASQQHHSPKQHDGRKHSERRQRGRVFQRRSWRGGGRLISITQERTEGRSFQVEEAASTARPCTEQRGRDSE